ncbi:MAG: ComF family protein [Clostridia bacterium]|nr:ComF family protein [Clostridia bacterium]
MKFLFSTLCPFCEKPVTPGDFLCESCRKKLTSYQKLPKCPLCGRTVVTTGICNVCEENSPKFDLAISCQGYHDVFKDGLLAYKFRREFYRAKGFSRLMTETFRKLGVCADCITAVPSDPFTVSKRGYNSSLELAFPMKKLLKLPFYPTLLRKKWFVKRQATLNRKERLENVKGNFCFSKRFSKRIAGKRILLVDDVMTTGATVNECCKLLKKNGAKEVYVVTLLGNNPN